jgi:chorismate synthase
LFRSRIGGVVVVVVVGMENGLGEHLHKKIFSHKKKKLFLDNNKGYLS